MNVPDGSDAPAWFNIWHLFLTSAPVPLVMASTQMWRWFVETMFILHAVLFERRVELLKIQLQVENY